MQIIRLMVWMVAIAWLGAVPLSMASPGEAAPKDVTITVVDDPEQLTEKVNRIPLPADGDEQPPVPGKQLDKTDHDNAAGEAQDRAASDSVSTKHDLDNDAQGDNDSVKQDTAGAQHPNADDTASSPHQ